jgi:hypothetical protein
MLPGLFFPPLGKYLSVTPITAIGNNFKAEKNEILVAIILAYCFKFIPDCLKSGLVKKCSI